MFNFYIIDCAGTHVSPSNLTVGPCQRFQQRQIKRPLIRALETQRHRHFHHDLHLYGNWKIPLNYLSLSNLKDLKKVMTYIFLQVFSTIVEYAIVLSIITFELDKVEYEINTERPAIRDRICMILKNPRKLDYLSVAVFSACFAIYNFDYWLITDHRS